MAKSSKRTHDEAAPASDAPMAVDTPSKAKKSKKDKDAEGDKEVDLATLCEIAKPLALAKTNKHSRHLKRGVKEVVKSLRKGEKGIVVLAADISPLDILTHIPVLAEESNCPYI
ncbi:SPOSA6832_01700, partial [Sporobolomyces salmonicolor]